MALTTTLETQHSAAQTTIRSLENKVEALEGMLQAAEEALKAKTVQEEEAKKIARWEVKEEEQKVEKASLTDMLAEWKKSVEGQWSHRSWYGNEFDDTGDTGDMGDMGDMGWTIDQDNFMDIGQSWSRRGPSRQGQECHRTDSGKAIQYEHERGIEVDPLKKECRSQWKFEQ